MTKGEKEKFQEELLTEDELRRIHESVAHVKHVYKEVFKKEIEQLKPVHLDEILPYFKKRTRWSKKNRAFSIMILGSALGQVMVESLDFEWVKYQDKLGEEHAVRHKKSDWRAFPYSSVGNRIRTKEIGYFSALVQSFKMSLEEEDY
jgi:hypothetical protein